MTATFRNTLLPILGIFLPFAASAATPLSPGDITIIFYSVDEERVVEPNTYVFNLGSGALFRENTHRGVSVTTVNPAITSGNIGADLTNVFGLEWAEKGTVRWCAVGLVGSTHPLTNGDPSRTAYFSRPRTNLTPGAIGAGSTIADISSSNRGALTTRLIDYFNGTNAGITANTAIVGTNQFGLIIPTSNNNSPDEFFPSSTNGTYFGQGIDPRQTLASGVIAGGTGVEGALDIYRILHTTAGADLTAGQSTGDAAPGVGQFIGTLTLDASGNLKIGAEGGAPVQNFETWATNNNITGGLGGDSDGDGILNIVEYALDLNLEGSDGSVGTFTAGVISFDKRADAVANGDVAYAIEVSDDLGVTIPWAPVAATSNTATEITFALPAGKTKTFARLRVTSPAN